MLGNCPKCYSDTAKMKRVSGMFCVRCESCGARTEYFTESEKAKFAWNNRMIQEWEGIPDEQIKEGKSITWTRGNSKPWR